jgi:hypothetical protein
MQGNDRVRRLKQFLETTLEEIKSKDLTGNKVGVEFNIGAAKGDVSSSEAASFIQALIGAVSKFDEDLVMSLGFTFKISHPAEAEIDAAVVSRMKSLIELEENTPKIVTAR